MSLYSIVLFLHIVGAIGYFVGMGTWLFLLAALRRAQRVEQVRTLTPLMGLIGPLILFSVLLLLAAGLYMAITTWGLLTGWIDVALISLLLIVPLGTAINEPRRRAIDRLAQEASDGPLSRSLEQRTHAQSRAKNGWPSARVDLFSIFIQGALECHETDRDG